MKRCRVCVLPENFPGASLNKDGVCNFCAGYKKRKNAKEAKRLCRKKFEKLLASTRISGEYHMLMCYSGGKDSTYTLKILRDSYKLKILAITVDNSFLAPRAFQNMKNVVEKLDVDHIIIKPRFEVVKKIFRASMRRSLYPPKTLERASTICTSCMGLVKYIALKTAIEKDIPFVGFGWSPGQAPLESSILKIRPAMLKSMEGILKDPMGRVAGSGIEPYFLNKRHYKKADGFPVFVHPLAFFDYSEKKILGEIKKLGWKKPDGVDYNATNCLLNSFADEVHINKHGFHPYALEIANFVRDGYMSRQEGLRHLPVRKNKRVVNIVKNRLEVS